MGECYRGYQRGYYEFEALQRRCEMDSSVGGSGPCLR